MRVVVFVFGVVVMLVVFVVRVSGALVKVGA